MEALVLARAKEAVEVLVSAKEAVGALVLAKEAVEVEVHLGSTIPV